MNILAFHNDSGSRWWRLESPAKWLNKNTDHQMLVLSHKMWKDDIAGAHIVVAEMFNSPKAVNSMHAMGAKVIYEADDALLDSYGKERKELVHQTTLMRESNIDTISKCDAMTVTSETLKKNYARFFKGPIYVLPNYMDFEWWGEPTDHKAERVSNEIRIGWAGSRSHHEDLRQILVPVMQKIMKKYPQVKFVYCGYGGMSSDKMVTEIGWGEDIFKELPRDRREYFISVPTEVWPIKSRTMDMDIGLAPLVKDYFNECKSNIKWQEYSSNKVPGIYSPTIYKDVVKHGKTGYIAETVEDWVKYISQLVEDTKLRKKIGKQAYMSVKKDWDMAKHHQEWAEAYREVLIS